MPARRGITFVDISNSRDSGDAGRLVNRIGGSHVPLLEFAARLAAKQVSVIVALALDVLEEAKLPDPHLVVRQALHQPNPTWHRLLANRDIPRLTVETHQNDYYDSRVLHSGIGIQVFDKQNYKQPAIYGPQSYNPPPPHVRLGLLAPGGLFSVLSATADVEAIASGINEITQHHTRLSFVPTAETVGGGLAG